MRSFRVGVVGIVTFAAGTVLAESRDSKFLLKQAESELTAGRAAEASRYLRDFVNSLPREAQAKLLIEQASGIAERLYALDTGNTQFTFQLAELYFLGRRYQDSLETLTRIGPQRADADYFNLAGMNYAAMGDLAVASRAVLKAIDMAPDRADLLVNLAGLYQRAKNNQDALRVLQKAVAMPSAQPQTFFALALTYYNLGNHSQAAENCARAIEANPDFDRAYLLMGRAYAAMGKAEPARKALRKGLALNPLCDVCRFELALLAGSNQEAEKLFRSTLAINPKHADAHFRLGKLLAEESRDEEAKAELRAAIAQAPDQDAAYYQLAILYKKDGDSSKAQKLFDTLRQRKEQRRISAEANLESPASPATQRAK